MGRHTAQRIQPFSGGGSGTNPTNTNLSSLSSFGVPTNRVSVPNYNFGGNNQFTNNRVNNTNKPPFRDGFFNSNSNNLNNDNTGGGSGGFGVGDTLSVLEGLTNAYLGYKSLGLAEDQFDFSKDTFNSNLANQTRAYNTNLSQQQRASLGAQGNFAGDSAGLEAALKSFLDENQLNGSPV